jgi:hypothetical protein
VIEHAQAAAVHFAQRAVEREQRGFARAGRAGEQDDFAGRMGR